MSEKGIEIVTSPRTRTTVLVIGAVSGALLGAASAYLLLRNADRKGGRFEFSVSEGVRIAVLAFGLLRSVAITSKD